MSRDEALERCGGQTLLGDIRRRGEEPEGVPGALGLGESPRSPQSEQGTGWGEMGATQPQEARSSMSEWPRAMAETRAPYGQALSQAATNGEVEVVSGLNLPGTVMERVVSSRNLSVQYTDGLECIQSWLRVREAGAEAS